MVDYREILRLNSLGYSRRRISSMVGSSHHTVDQTLAAAECSGIEWPLDDDITNEELQSIMFPGKYAYASPYTIPDFPQIHRDLAKPGVTLTLLHEEYCRKVLLSGGVPYMLKKITKMYSTVDLLILDEWLQRSLTVNQSFDLLDIIAYEKATYRFFLVVGGTAISLKSPTRILGRMKGYQ